MNELRRNFTHLEIMREFEKLSALLGYTSNELTEFLKKSILNHEEGKRISAAMHQHNRTMKERLPENKVRQDTILHIRIYSTNFIAIQQAKKKQKLSTDSIAKSAIHRINNN